MPEPEFTDAQEFFRVNLYRMGIEKGTETSRGAEKGAEKNAEMYSTGIETGTKTSTEEKSIGTRHGGELAQIFFGRRQSRL